MSDQFQNFNSPLGQSLGQNTQHLEFIALASGFSSTETNIFTEIWDVLQVDRLADHEFASMVTFLSKWDKNVGKIVHGRVPEENIRNVEKKDYLRKHGIHYIIQRARRDMDQLIETLDQLRIAVGNANEEFERENDDNRNENSVEESYDIDENLDGNEDDNPIQYEQGRNVRQREN